MLRLRVTAVVGGVAVAAILSCTSDEFLNVTTSLGGDTPGGRGAITATFINNTRYRATFTTGVFDPQDQTTVPAVTQFFDSTVASERLEANSTSAAVSFQCAREWSVGGDRLLELLVEREQTGGLDQTALERGVQFFEDDLTTPETENVLVGRAEPVSALLGPDYQCESLITFRLEEVGGGQFRVEFDVVLP